jgi:hypothetical protein
MYSARSGSDAARQAVSVTTGSSEDIAIIRDGPAKVKCPVDMDWIPAGYALVPRWVSELSSLFSKVKNNPM